MKPVITEYASRYEVRRAKEDRTCWTWQERMGSDEPQCTRIIGKGELYLVNTIYPGHDSGYADGGTKLEIVWTGLTTYEWQQVPIPPRPVESWFCLPCCERWRNLGDALAAIRKERPDVKDLHPDGDRSGQRAS